MEFETETVSVEAPDPPATIEMLAGFTAPVMPEMEALAFRLTVAVSPELLSVIPDLAVPPDVIVRLERLAMIVKLPVTVTVKETCRRTPPLVALTVMMYVPALVPTPVLMVSVEFAEPPGVNWTEVGVRVELRPERIEALSVTLPVKPRLRTVTLAVADLPASKEEEEVKLAVRV